jgi:serpin B
VGARGETLNQMTAVLHLDFSLDETAARQGQLQALLNDGQSNGKVKLAIANSIWPERTYALRQEYLTLLERHYKVSVSPCDFIRNAGRERERINGWVEDNTNDRIKDLLPDGLVTSDTRLVLANAVWFKGDWARQFKASATTQLPFHLSSGEQVEVPMMMQKASFLHGRYPGVQVLSLPYAGGDLSMVVLLPENPDGLSALETELSAEKLGRWINALSSSEMRVHFPKFRAESSLNLPQTMQALGMIDAFSPSRADFSGMTALNDLFISDAMHKAFVEVNEEGTEAAAATGIVMKVRSTPVSPPSFRADHPFLYLVRHDPTGTILFMGRMSDPSKSQRATSP